jgi:hypothetical protein
MELDVLGDKLLTELRGAVGDSWNSWTPEEKLLVQRCAQRAARIAVMAAAGKDVSADKLGVDAQLANIKAAVAGSVASTVWEIAQRLLKTAVAVLT